MKVTITICATLDDGNEQQRTTQTLPGFLRRCEQSYELTYREPNTEEGLGNTLTTLRVFGDRMELARQGDYRCLLTMEPGVSHETDYDTPLGRFVLTTETQAFCSALQENGNGDVSVCYRLHAAGGSTQHTLQITVTPA